MTQLISRNPGWGPCLAFSSHGKLRPREAYRERVGCRGEGFVGSSALITTSCLFRRTKRLLLLQKGTRYEPLRKHVLRMILLVAEKNTFNLTFPLTENSSLGPLPPALVHGNFPRGWCAKKTQWISSSDRKKTNTRRNGSCELPISPQRPGAVARSLCLSSRPGCRGSVLITADYFLIDSGGSLNGSADNRRGASRCLSQASASIPVATGDARDSSPTGRNQRNCHLEEINGNAAESTSARARPRLSGPLCDRNTKLKVA